MYWGIITPIENTNIIIKGFHFGSLGPLGPLPPPVSPPNDNGAPPNDNGGSLNVVIFLIIILFELFCLFFEIR